MQDITDKIMGMKRNETCAVCGTVSSEGMCGSCERAIAQEDAHLQCGLEELGLSVADWYAMTPEEQEECKEAMGMLGDEYKPSHVGELPYKCTPAGWDAETFIAHLQKEHEQRNKHANDQDGETYEEDYRRR